MVDGAAKPIDRTGIILFVIPMAITTILAWVGDAFAPTLLVEAPLILTDPFFYWFGRRYGDVAIRWMERKLGPGAAVVLWLERFFARGGAVAVAVIPNQWICLLAGATKMRVWVFV